MFDQDGIRQEKIAAGGNVSGRDMHTVINVLPLNGSTYVANLERRFLAEQENDIRVQGIIPKLQHYLELTKEETVLIGLEKKLRNGGFDKIVNFAMDTKEQFSKHLMLYALSPSAQMIHAHMLAKVYTCFSMYVLPSIQEGKDQNEIISLLRVKIFEEIENCLGNNVLNILDDEIAGMIFFLTGNCHLQWS